MTTWVSELGPLDGDRPSIATTVSARARGMIAERGMLQRDLAAAMGISAAGISRRLGDEMEFQLSEVPLLAAVLGTSSAYLLGMTETRAPRADLEPAGDVVRHRGLEPRTR